MLPSNWQKLNEQLHSFYGYSSNLIKHADCQHHLEELIRFIEEDHPDSVLIQTWVDKLSSLIPNTKRKLENGTVRTRKRANQSVAVSTFPSSSTIINDDGSIDAPSHDLAMQQLPKTAKSKSRTVLQPSSPTQLSGVNYQPQLKNGRKGTDIDIDEVRVHPSFILRMPTFRWAILKGATQQVVNQATNKPVMVLIPGQIDSARCSIYGDFSPLYHSSLVSPTVRSMIIRLNCLPQMSSEWSDITRKLNEIENALTPNFHLQATHANRCVKSPSVIELRRKLAVRVSTPDFFIPNDREGNS
jgi:hypothetical protein